MKSCKNNLIGAVGLLTIGLVAADGLAQDIVRRSNDGKRGSRVQRSHQGEGIEPQGTVTLLQAHARVNTATSTISIPGNGGQAIDYRSGSFPASAGPATVTGQVFTAKALAQINVNQRNNYWTWNSEGSYATRTKSADGNNETYLARAIIKDPMEFVGIQPGDRIDLFTEIGVEAVISGMSSVDSGETCSSWSFSYDETSIFGLGILWSYGWTTSSSDPTRSEFAFTSNPRLGLNDEAIMADFSSRLVYDPQTDSQFLSSPWSVHVSFVADGSFSSFTFGGGDEIGVAGAIVPAPGAAACALAGFLVAAGRRRR